MDSKNNENYIQPVSYVGWHINTVSNAICVIVSETTFVLTVASRDYT